MCDDLQTILPLPGHVATVFRTGILLCALDLEEIKVLRMFALFAKQTDNDLATFPLVVLGTRLLASKQSTAVTSAASGSF